MAITNLDESRIRANDLGLLFAVERVLGQHGIDAEIVGSVVTVNDRSQYRDIDLKVAYRNASPRSEALCQLVRAANPTLSQSPEVVRESQRIRDLLGAEATLVSDAKQQTRYVGTFIEHRFKIRSGRTTIDLCFEGMPMRSMLENFLRQPNQYETYRNSFDEEYERDIDSQGNTRRVLRRTSR